MSEPTLSLRRLVGALVFAARQPLTVKAIRRLLEETAQAQPETGAAFGSVKDRDIAEALAEAGRAAAAAEAGFELSDGADGYRFQSDPLAGPWLRQMLDAGKPARLSRPALETLAIVAYRQPATRAEIEGVRGVAVDHVLRLLMELQLVRITGRSELPGRPLLYGTTPAFLEHFGLKEIRELPGLEELARREAARASQAATASAAAEEASEAVSAEAEPNGGAPAAAVDAGPAEAEVLDGATEEGDDA